MRIRGEAGERKAERTELPICYFERKADAQRSVTAHFRRPPSVTAGGGGWGSDGAVNEPREPGRAAQRKPFRKPNKNARNGKTSALNANAALRSHAAALRVRLRGHPALRAPEVGG